MSDPNAKNDLGMNDDIAKATTDAMKEQYEKEIKLFTENLERLDRGKERMQEQWEVDKRIYELRLEGDNNTPVTPMLKFETLPEYQELVKKKLQWKFDQEVFMEEERQKKYERDRAQILELLESNKKELDKLNGEGESNE